MKMSDATNPPIWKTTEVSHYWLELMLTYIEMAIKGIHSKELLENAAKRLKEKMKEIEGEQK
jgi:hypothetical protein